MSAIRIIDDHIELDNIGSNSHAQIDTHITNSSIHQTKYTDAEAVAAVNGNCIGCHYQRRSGQTVLTDTWTKIEFNVPTWDIGGDYDTTNHRFVASKAGHYQVNANVALIDLNSFKKFVVMIRKNGVNLAAGRGVGDTDNYATGISTATVVEMVINDYLEVFVYHKSTPESPSSKSVASESGYTTFSVIKVC